MMALLKFSLFFYIFAALVAVILLWRNSASPDVLQNAGILVAGVLPALIAILPYLKADEKSLEYSYVIFFDEQIKRAVWPGTYDPYSRAYSHAFYNLDESGITSREISAEELKENYTNEYWTIFHHERGLDLIERAIVVKIEDMFKFGWDIDPKTFKTPTGSEKRMSIHSEDGTAIGNDDLKNIFKHNDLISKHGHLSGFKLPPNSVLQATATGEKVFSQRNIIVKNNEVLLKINIIPSGGTIAPQGIWGVLSPQPELKTLRYRVAVEVKYPYATNNSETIRYKKWFQNVSSSLSELDWATIDVEVEKSLFRKMLFQVPN